MLTYFFSLKANFYSPGASHWTQSCLTQMHSSSQIGPSLSPELVWFLSRTHSDGTCMLFRSDPLKLCQLPDSVQKKKCSNEIWKLITEQPWSWDPRGTYPCPHPHPASSIPHKAASSKAQRYLRRVSSLLLWTMSSLSVSSCHQNFQKINWDILYFLRVYLSKNQFELGSTYPEVVRRVHQWESERNFHS